MNDFLAATQACNERQAAVCPIEALLACDLTPPAGSDCSEKTDDGATRLWSGTVEPLFDQEVLQSLVVYRGDNFLSIADVGELHPYYCCTVPGTPLSN